MSMAPLLASIERRLCIIKTSTAEVDRREAASRNVKAEKG